MTETAIVAIVSALFGFLGGLVPSVSSALKSRADAKLGAKQVDLDHLRIIIDELQEEIERRKKDQEAERAALEARIVVLETDCTTKDQRIGELEAKLTHLLEERNGLEKKVAALTTYIDLLTKIMQQHNIPVPERKATDELKP